jgi:hypothetical protein
MLGFLLGAIAGGAAVYYWRDTIRGYVSERGPSLRDRAAERLGEIGESAGSALERARARIDSTVRSGQDRLRSTGTTDAPSPGVIDPSRTTGAGGPIVSDTGAPLHGSTRREGTHGGPSSGPGSERPGVSGRPGSTPGSPDR